tara:strand:- start:269 stop:412 length:144 start_codon:yes stop_codon:yes gene_type:complete
MARKYMKDTRVFKSRKQAEKASKFFRNVMGRETKISKNKEGFFIKLR